MKLIKYLEKRLLETSTFVAVGAAIPIAAGLVWPWSLLSVVVAVVGTLVPDKNNAA